MELFSLVLVVMGLVLFEIINSIDNAIINAEVLSTMSKKAQRWFLFVGILTAVFLVRGLLPWIIIWVSNPSLSIIDALIATFSADAGVRTSLEESAPILLTGSGVFLVLLFLHWFFMEEKHAIFKRIEPVSKKKAYYAISIVLLMTSILLLSIGRSKYIGFSALIGLLAFLITEQIKDSSEKSVKSLKKATHYSDITKIIYLEVIDASFSIDGVMGAFAFTFSVPLIILGSGIGALVVRNITVRNIGSINKYLFIKNGAMYSICFLGIIMLCNAFGVFVPTWVAPTVTFFIVASFFGFSKAELNREKNGMQKV